MGVVFEGKQGLTVRFGFAQHAAVSRQQRHANLKQPGDFVRLLIDGRIVERRLQADQVRGEARPAQQAFADVFVLEPAKRLSDKQRRYSQRNGRCDENAEERSGAERHDAEVGSSSRR
jgi:hypothetical protein